MLEKINFVPPVPPYAPQKKYLDMIFIFNVYVIKSY